jgi:S1-C subfamily serine protease
MANPSIEAKPNGVRGGDAGQRPGFLPRLGKRLARGETPSSRTPTPYLAFTLPRSNDPKNAKVAVRSGDVIGMDTAASDGFSFQSADGSSGYQGYAIPINEAATIAKEIESGQASSTVHIGVTGFLGVEIESNERGGASTVTVATVAGVITDSPAEEAGLSAGDIITAVDGHAVDSATALTGLLDPYHSGDAVTVTWTDPSGSSHTATIQLSSGPPE